MCSCLRCSQWVKAVGDNDRNLSALQQEGEKEHERSLSRDYPDQEPVPVSDDKNPLASLDTTPRVSKSERTLSQDTADKVPIHRPLPSPTSVAPHGDQQ